MLTNTEAYGETSKESRAATYACDVETVMLNITQKENDLDATN